MSKKTVKLWFFKKNVEIKFWCAIIIYRKKKGKIHIMKKDIETTEKKVNKKNRERGEIFIKIMAGVLALLMLVGTSASFIYALMNI